MTEFVVNSRGYCFLCLNTVGGQLNQSSPIICSVLLSRNLALDMQKVLHENGLISAQLLAKVQKSPVRVKLCRECVDLNERYVEVYQQLGVAEMKVSSCLDQIRRRLSRAWEDCGSESVDGILQTLKITDVLRRETTKKCGHKLDTVQPRVYIRRLGSEEAAASPAGAMRSSLSLPSESETETPRMDHEPEIGAPQIRTNIIKVETEPSRGTSPEPDMDDEDSLAGHFDEDQSQDSQEDPDIKPFPAEAPSPSMASEPGQKRRREKRRSTQRPSGPSSSSDLQKRGTKKQRRQEQDHKTRSEKLRETLAARRQRDPAGWAEMQKRKSEKRQLTLAAKRESDPAAWEETQRKKARSLQETLAAKRENDPAAWEEMQRRKGQKVRETRAAKRQGHPEPAGDSGEQAVTPIRMSNEQDFDGLRDPADPLWEGNYL